jgi:hypothetical protein
VSVWWWKALAGAVTDARRAVRWYGRHIPSTALVDTTTHLPTVAEVEARQSGLRRVDWYVLWDGSTVAVPSEASSKRAVRETAG